MMNLMMLYILRGMVYTMFRTHTSSPGNHNIFYINMIKGHFYIIILSYNLAINIILTVHKIHKFINHEIGETNCIYASCGKGSRMNMSKTALLNDP